MRIETDSSHQFTFEYSQPREYHFCLDSVLAPKVIAQDLRASVDPDTLKALNILDVCAGCGVFGFELSYHLPEVASVDFLEIQEAYLPYFETNKATVSAKIPSRFGWIQAPYSSLPEHAGKYDVIVANPPYFYSHEGTLSPSELNNRSRFFLDDSLESLITGIESALKPDGRAYILAKSGRNHGRDTFQLIRKSLKNLKAEKIADIRGTDLVKLAATKW